MAKYHGGNGGSSTSSPPPFHFQQPQGRIDWATLETLDINRLIRDTDLDALEAILPSVAHGSLRKYHSSDLTSQSMRRLFEASQMAVQYLLYVQNRLAADARAAKTQLEKSQSDVRSLQTGMSELRRDLEVAERETRHSRRMLRIALAQAQATVTTTAATAPSVTQPLQPIAPPSPSPPPSPPPPAVSQVVPSPQDPESVERLKRLEEGIRELLQWKQVAAAAASETQNNPPPLQSTATRRNSRENNRPSSSSYDTSTTETTNISPRPPAPPPAYTPPRPASPQAAMESREDINPTFTHFPHQHSQQQGGTFSQARSQRSPSPPPSTAPSKRSPPHSPPVFQASPLASPSPHQDHPSPIPSPLLKRQFVREMSYQAVGYERPGVMSRFPHRLGDLRAVRQELQAELESELAAELASQGIVDSESCQGLSPAEYLACMEALRQRRSASTSQMTPQDRAREQYMRSTVTWHVDDVTKSVAAATKTGASPQPAAAPLQQQQQQQPARSPTRAAALRTKQQQQYYSQQQQQQRQQPSPSIPYSYHSNPSASPSPVDLAMLEVRDDETDAFYSPLRRGTSSEPGTPPSNYQTLNLI